MDLEVPGALYRRPWSVPAVAILVLASLPLPSRPGPLSSPASRSFFVFFFGILLSGYICSGFLGAHPSYPLGSLFSDRQLRLIHIFGACKQS